MKSSDTNLEDQVIRLPHRDRARIALALIDSLDPGKDEDVTELWLDEAERREMESESRLMGAVTLAARSELRKQRRLLKAAG